jgi:hypothetical protein
MKFAIIALLLVTASLSGPVIAGTPATYLKPGQYDLNDHQFICLKDDGTWYGINYTAKGQWANPGIKGVVSVIYGNYGAEEGQYKGYGNVALIATTRFGFTDWWDWHDDNTYQFFEEGIGFPFEKAKCDPPTESSKHETASRAPWMPHRSMQSSLPDDNALVPGQYLLAGTQKVCLKDDGTWYGDKKHPYSGQWSTPAGEGFVGILYGNYGESLGKYQGFGNTVILVTRQTHQKANFANWLDWRDNLGHTTFTGETTFTFERTQCAPPGVEASDNGAVPSR